MSECANGHRLQEGSLYCTVCGAKAVAACPNGHDSPLDAGYCPLCGADLKAPNPGGQSALEQARQGRQTRQWLAIGLPALTIVILAAGVYWAVAQGSDNDPSLGPVTTEVDNTSGERAYDYFVESESLCIVWAESVGNSGPEAARYEDVEVLEVIDMQRVRIRDGVGEEFVVDHGLDPPAIYPAAGPDAQLPADLAFGCPEDVYLGSWE